MIRAMSLSVAALILSGCTNAIGFAPPAVEIKYANQPNVVVTCSGKIDCMHSGVASPRGHRATQSGVDHQQSPHDADAMLVLHAWP